VNVDPIRIVSKIKNNRLMEYREGLGKSTKEMAGLIGISYASYLNLEGCKHYPSQTMARKIADATGNDVEWLFPGFLKTISKTTAIHTIPESNLIALSEVKQALLTDGTQDKDLFLSEMNDAIQRALTLISPREKRILEMLYGLNGECEHTQVAIAKEFCITHERVRQIEEHALRKLRNPNRSRLLRNFYLDAL